MKPKTIRLELIDALDTEERTIDAMIDLLPQHDRKKIASNLQAAKTDGLISVRRDDSTGLPAYRLTASGLAMLAASRGNVKPEPEERQAAAQGKGTGESLPKAEAKEEFTLLGVIADIRRAIGDDTGKVMLSDLAETIREIAVRASRLSKENAILTTTNDAATSEVERLTTAIESLNEKHRTLFDDFVRVVAENTAIKHESPKASQYLILSPKRKPQRVKSRDKAQDIALSAARTRGIAEVYALVPAGRAMRGAVWKEQA